MCQSLQLIQPGPTQAPEGYSRILLASAKIRLYQSFHYSEGQPLDVAQIRYYIHVVCGKGTKSLDIPELPRSNCAPVYII